MIILTPGLWAIPRRFWPAYGLVAMTGSSGLETGLDEGATAARPIWEYFMAKTLADKDLGLSRKAKFVQPENMKNDMMYDYMNIIDKTPPPGAEGENQGNGNANQYLDTSSPTIPIDSKLSTDEQNVLKEANAASRKSESAKPENKPEEKKKKGFFRRLFGGKK